MTPETSRSDRDSRAGRGKPRGRATPVGSLYGYEVLVLGESTASGRAQAWAVPQGSVFTADPYEVFRARTEPYSLDSIVSSVAALTRQRELDRGAFEQTIERAGGDPRLVFQPFLLRRLVTDVIAHRPLPDDRIAEIPVAWLVAAERILMDVVADADRNTHAGGQWAVQSMAARMIQAQYHDQMARSDYVRELWITMQTVARAATFGLDLEEAYREKFGFSYSDLAFLSFAAFGTVAGQGSGLLDEGTWMTPVVAVNAATTQAYFRAVVLDYPGLKERVSASGTSADGYARYNRKLWTGGLGESVAYLPS